MDRFNLFGMNVTSLMDGFGLFHAWINRVLFVWVGVSQAFKHTDHLMHHVPAKSTAVMSRLACTLCTCVCTCWCAYVCVHMWMHCHASIAHACAFESAKTGICMHTHSSNFKATCAYTHPGTSYIFTLLRLVKSMGIFHGLHSPFVPDYYSNSVGAIPIYFASCSSTTCV